MDRHAMTESESKEYHSVVLAALLHDIGKLLHRIDDATYHEKGGHSKAGAQFIDQYHKTLRNDAQYDLDLVRFLVRYHMKKGLKREDILRDPFIQAATTNKKRAFKLRMIVQDADTYSCAEREQEGYFTPDRSEPLKSIFQNIDFSRTGHSESNRYNYPLSVLNPLKCFPETFDKLGNQEFEDFIGAFKGPLPDFSQYDNFNDIINAWLDILQQYTCNIPSDTCYDNPDVSLYDHSRSSAAFAACLYKRHLESIRENRQFKRAYEFILIGGDYSGIQDYISHITNRGSGGASKRLRARSFFVYLFSEATIHKILYALDLPLVCNLFSSGGKFLLLAPNIGGVEDTLQRAKAEIDREISRTYFNQFSFLLSWMEINGSETKNRPSEFRIYSFFKSAEDMFHRLETDKLQKFSSILVDSDLKTWCPATFKATEMYAQYSESGDCKICGRGPGIKADVDPDTKEVTMCCPACYRDKYIIGEELPRAKFIAFGKGVLGPDADAVGDKIVLFHSTNPADNTVCDGYYAQLLKTPRVMPDHYLVYKLFSKDEGMTLPEQRPILRKYYANHVPVEENRGADPRARRMGAGLPADIRRAQSGQVPCSGARRRGEALDEVSAAIPGDAVAGNKILSFKRIAEKSLWANGDHTYGSDLLGVLKADVDNLGLVFSKGFENPSRLEKGYDDIDRKTVSRFLTLSRMIELFFSGWVRDIMEADRGTIIQHLLETENINREDFEKYLRSASIDFKNIYTVYSGGDDLVLVGPWETMIVFSIFLNMQFRKYTCNNEFITLSAGLAFVKEKHPIASAIRQADELLETSKKNGKDSLNLFGATIKWENLPDLVNFFLFLDRKLNQEEPEINMAFLHRLLEYHHMAVDFIDNNNLEGLKYISALSYDLGRNVVKWDKNDNITKGRETYDFLTERIIKRKPEKGNATIYNLKVPLFWILYRNRKAQIEN